MTFDPLTYSSPKDLNGNWHIPFSAEIREISTRTADLIHEFNQLPPSASERRRELLKEIFNPASADCFVQQPFRVEYGQHTTVGEGVFINYNCTILDTAPVTIGSGVLIGPNCQLITVGHPVDDVEMRCGGWEIAHPVVLEDNVWLGAGVTVLPGVRIGENSVIGAASVVTKDIPPNSVAVGSPARVIRSLDPDKFERSQLPADAAVRALEHLDFSAFEN